MLKFLVILFVFAYVTFKFGGFIIKALQSLSGEDPQQKNFNGRSQRKTDGNVNIDYDPGAKKKGNSGYQGGEYVDYEEIK